MLLDAFFIHWQKPHQEILKVADCTVAIERFDPRANPHPNAVNQQVELPRDDFDFISCNKVLQLMRKISGHARIVGNLHALA